MDAVRHAAVAGTFYPDQEQELIMLVDGMLARAKSDQRSPKVIIAPHAGYIYSGQTAAIAYARLRNARQPISRVVLLGPSHQVAFKGIAVPTQTRFKTPLGEIGIDAGSIQQILGLPGVGFLDDAHSKEHSLEVQLPFLQRVLGEFNLVPLVVGDASREDVAAVINTLWGHEETLIIISSDLSHYHTYDEATEKDSRTSAKIVSLNSTLTSDEACGARPVNGLLHALNSLAGRKFTIQQLNLCNSGDTAGTRERVVGYGAYVVVEDDYSLSLAVKQRLIQVARESVLQMLENKQEYRFNRESMPPVYSQPRATFVTLNSNDQLRGCIGSLAPHRSLVDDVASNARAAAFNDPRFPPVSLSDYHTLEFHISVLSPAEVISVNSQAELIAALRPGIDGLILEQGENRATYLPSVWQQLPDPGTFIAELRRKAGLSRIGWHPDTVVHRYTTEEFC